MSDPDPLERCRRGDQRAWSALIERHAGLVYAIARAHRLGDADADDLAQHCFAALAASIHHIADERAIPAWLRTTATRECWRIVRAARRRTRTARAAADTSPDHNPAPPPEHLLDTLEQHAQLRIALDQLGDRCRQLLLALARSTAGSAYDRIADELGIPRGSIGPTRRRCLERLAQHMAEKPDQTTQSAP
jgi:RNA polymerase sigma factor (sigma-70 family)